MRRFAYVCEDPANARLTYYVIYVVREFMHSVCELLSFRRAAHAAGMTNDEIDELVDFLAKNPMAGDEIAGTGGRRKLRVAGRGKGKSGGCRAISFYSGAVLPVFLITVFGKGEKVNLNQRGMQ